MRRELGMTALLLALAVNPVAAGKGTRGGSKGIVARDLRGHVAFLADDTRGGRDTGEPGSEEAERYIAAAFAAMKLSPLPGHDHFFLDYTLYRRGFDADRTGLTLESGGETASARVGIDFRPFGFSDSGEVDAHVVFAGYGITADEYGWDDYAGLDVAGKIVLVLRHEPGENDPSSPFDGVSSSEHALFETKMRNARAHGVAGMLLVTDPLHHDGGDDLRSGGMLRLEAGESSPAVAQEEPASDRLIAMQISRSLAQRIVGGSGSDLAALQRDVDGGRHPSSVDLGKVTARIAVERSTGYEEVAVRNVAAFIAGSDPRLREEWLVVGAHHDHIGSFEGAGDTVFNGADDNASGTAGLLELAEAFAGRDTGPARSIVFVTFSGEEKGLLGSRAVVEQALIPRERMVFMLNLDMIGRNADRPLQVFGDGYVNGLREIVEEANRGIDVALDFGGVGYSGASDHHPFYEADLPFMFFFTGIHEDYHQLGDHANKLSYGRMESIVRLAYGVLDRVASAAAAPSFIHNVDWLGVRVEVVDGAASVIGVEQESRGAVAGIQLGDAIRAFDDAPLIDADGVGIRFRAIDPGIETTLLLAHEGAEREVVVVRAKTGYMGIFPGPANEDLRRRYGLGQNDGIVLRQVVADGPCGEAGLEPGDLVVAIAGRPVGSMNLRARLRQIGAGETVDVSVIRGGERFDLPVTLGERPERR